MATFRQSTTIYEDSFNEYTILFVMSDSYDGLFATSGVKQTQVFMLGSVKSDLDIADGKLAQDELSLSCLETAIETTDDADAVQFFKDGQNPATPRYCAVFVDEAELPTPPDVEKALFIGQLLPEHKGQDIQHHGDSYSTAINAVREWDARAGTFMDEVVDRIPLYDLIYGNDDDSVLGITTAWEAAYVEDRIGWHKSSPGDPYGSREARFHQLVSLSDVLRRIADNVEATLAAQGAGSYNIIFDDMTFDWKVSPARFKTFPSLAGTWKSRHLLSQGAGGPFEVKADDMKSLGLGDSKPADEQVYIHYRMVKPATKNEQQYSFLRCKTFTELLYALADSFRVYVRFWQPNTTDLHIQFLSRNEVERPQVYWRDAEEGDINLTLSTSEREGSTKHAGVACVWALDGHDVFITDGFDKRASSTLNRPRNGEAPLLTVSPTLTQLAISEDAGRTNIWAHLPHNSVFYNGGAPEAYNDSPYKASLGIHTGIYVRCNVIDEKVDPFVPKIFLPAAMVHATIDGVDETFTSLSEYSNRVKGRDATYFMAEYNLTIPYFNSWAQMPGDVLSIGWNMLELGCKVVIQEGGVDREFVVVGIERQLSYPETKVRLHALSRVAFSPPAANPDPLQPIFMSDPSIEDSTVEDTPTAVYIADAAIEVGDAVAADPLQPPTHCIRATSTQTMYGRIIGIAMSAATAGNPVSVRTAGRVQVDTWSFTPGKRVFVRTATHPASNVSQTPLLGKTVSEDLHAIIGVADSTTSMIIDTSHQYILE
jgi:hypothetical protein